MIRIEIENVQQEVNDELTRSTLELVARSLAERMQQQVKDLACKSHPDRPHSIILKPLDSNIQVVHSPFCCKNFEKKLNSVLKSPKSRNRGY
jgi:hypothetical protein